VELIVGVGRWGDVSKSNIGADEFAPFVQSGRVKIRRGDLARGGWRPARSPLAADHDWRL
jgi:hypothetical protein